MKEKEFTLVSCLNFIAAFFNFLVWCFIFLTALGSFISIYRFVFNN